MFTLAGRTIWIAGHSGLVGSALLRRLQREDARLVTATHRQLDLTRQADVEDFVAEYRPDAIVLAAARVGGILANQDAPADFLHDNLAIAANVITAAHRCDVERLLYLGSSCIYPRDAVQPIREDALLTGPLEPSNEAYAVAKIAGLKMVEAMRRQHGRDYIAAMPTNLYGPGDNFDLATAHVLPALIRKAHEAKRAGAATVAVWGSGAPRRELLFADDCADALVLLLQRYSAESPVNVGTGMDMTIAELARLVCDIVGFGGAIAFEPDKPDGTPGKRLDLTRLDALGWRARTPLREGIAQTYRWFLEQVAIPA